MILVKIKGMVTTSQYGTLSDGTLLRTNEAFAKHLVEDASAAEYVTDELEEKELKTDDAEVSVKKRGRPAKE